MSDNVGRPGQYSLKWAMLQMTLCSFAFASFIYTVDLWGGSDASPDLLAGVLTFFGLFASVGAIVGGLGHQFALGAAIGAFLAVPGFCAGFLVLVVL